MLAGVSTGDTPASGSDGVIPCSDAALPGRRQCWGRPGQLPFLIGGEVEGGVGVVAGFGPAGGDDFVAGVEPDTVWSVDMQVPEQ